MSLINILLAAGPYGAFSAIVLLLVLALRRRRWQPSAPAERPSSWPTRRILVVDDDPVTVDAMTRLLAIEARNVKIDGVFSGEEALDRVRRTAYDLILTDLRMPGMGGAAFVRRLREESMRPLVRVVIVTALDPHATAGLIADTGANDVVQKPIKIAALLEVVHSHLDPGLGLVRADDPLVR